MHEVQALDADSTSALHRDYSVGSIKSIELWDFVIHEYLYFPCSSRINFVIGANGTGKSTIVCAICLGLGGDTSYMERSKSLQDFIRHGCASATIKIVLQNFPGEPDLVIKRVIQRGSNHSSSWYIMNRQCTAKDVRELLGKMRIQIANPTQFLPQERISEFSKLVPQDMLRYILMSVDERLLDKRSTLMEKESKQKDMTSLLRNRESVLREKRNRRDALESVLAEVELRRKLENEIELIRHAQILTKKKELGDRRSREQQALADVDAQLSALVDEAALVKAVLDCEEASRVAIADHQTKEREYMYAISRLERAHADIRSRRNVITNKLAEYEAMNTSASIEGEIQELKGSIKETEEVYARLQESLDEPRLRELERENTEISNKHTSIERELRTMDIRQNALARDAHRLRMVSQNVVDVRSVKRRKVVSYDRSSTNAMQAFEAMLEAETRGEFQRPVLGPLIAEIECDSVYANAIEACVPAWLQRAFLSQTYPDLKLLNQILSGASTIYYQHDRAEATIALAKQRSRVTPRDVERIRTEAGLTDLRHAYEVVRADKVVLGAIFANSGFANALITTDPNFERKINNVMARYEGQTNSFIPPGVSIFGTHQRSLSFRPNKYTSGSYYVSMSNRPSVILTQAVDNSNAIRAGERLEQLNKELETFGPQQKALKDELDALKAQHETIQRDLLRLRSIRADTRKNAAKLESQKRTLANLETQLRDQHTLSQEREKLAMEIKKLQIQALRETTKVATYVSDAATMYGRLSAQVPIVVKAESELEEASREYELWKRQHRQLFERKQEITDKISALSREIAALQDQYDEVIAAITDEEQRSFISALPQSSAELETLLEEKVHLMRAIHYDQASVEEYERVQKEIQELEAQVDQSGGASTQLEKEIHDLRRELVSSINSIANTLNTHFVSYLGLINAKGAVVFEDQEAVQNWGLKVMVSFSQGRPISTLQSTTFSGGERAIATMLVLMALQSVSSVPFRVIDEINQGMDARNERVVMETLISGISNTGDSTPLPRSEEEEDSDGDGEGDTERGRQLFIVSPKLLPRLKHADVLHTTIVFNGPVVQESNDVQNFFAQFSSPSFLAASSVASSTPPSPVVSISPVRGHSAATADYFVGHSRPTVGRKRALEV